MTPLRHRMIGDMAIRNLADNTQAAYLQQITLFSSVEISRLASN